ncbi:MAG: hypothetical protein LBS88_05865, partial [Tannerellaceae bacterium]|nr:hypothetical protein [Tannerellaceae bacterium]
VIKDEFKARGLDKAREVLALDNLTPEERKAYDYMEDQRSKDLSMIASSKLEGQIEGREEGRIEGREEGRIEREKIAEELEKEREAREAREKELEKEREEREAREKELEKEREARERLAGENEILLAEIARLKQNEQNNKT